MSENGRPSEDKSIREQAGEKDDTNRINAIQVVAATCAASTAAVVANALGIAGTVVGVAAFSVVSSVATVLYLKSMHHTKEKLDKVRSRTGAQTVMREPAPGAATETGPVTTARGTAAVPTATVAAESSPSAFARATTFLKRNWRPLAVSSLIVFVLSVGLLTGLALVSGQPATTYYGAHPHESSSSEQNSPSGGSDQDGSGDSESSGEETPSGDETPSTEPDGPTTSEAPSEEPEPSTQDSGGTDSGDSDRDLKATPSPGDNDASDR